LLPSLVAEERLLRDNGR